MRCSGHDSGLSETRIIDRASQSKIRQQHALDTVLPDLGRPTKARLLEAMAGHVLAEAQLVGLYQKGR